MTNGPLLTQKFEDRKSVYMLTTAHKAGTVTKTKRGGQTRTVPECIDNYNKHMVDRIDQMLEPYDATRKTVRWYVKLAVHLIQIAVLNGYTLYHKRGGKNDFQRFSRNVIAALIFRDAVTPNINLQNEDLCRLTAIYEIPPTQCKRPKKGCKVCYKRGQRRDTRFYCPKCPSQPGLCLGDCFERYHTKEAFWL